MLLEADSSRYDPESKKYGVDSYKGESTYLSTIALRKDQPGVSLRLPSAQQDSWTSRNF